MQQQYFVIINIYIFIKMYFYCYIVHKNDWCDEGLNADQK